MRRHSSPIASSLLLGLVLLAAPGCARAPEDLYARASESASAGDAQSAVVDLKAALQKKPDFAAARVLLGAQMLELGDPEAAAKELQAAIKLGARPADLLQLLVRAELDRGNPAAALRMLAARPDRAFDADLWNFRGEALTATQDTQGALRAFGQALRLDARSADAHLGLARIAWAAGNLGEADREFARAATLGPANHRVWLAKGEFHLARRQFPPALAAFRTADKLAKGMNRWPAQVGVARTLLFSGDVAGAQKVVDEIIQEKPSLPMGRYVSALVAYQKHDRTKASAELDRVLARVPGHVPSISLQGAIYMDQQRWVDAKEALVRVVALTPKDVSARKMLATAYLRLGRVAKAVEVLEPARELAPGDPQLLAMLGAAYLQAGQSDRGLATMEQAAALAPSSPEFRTQLALGRLALGETATGTSELRTAANLRADDLRADVLLVMVLLRQGKAEEALAEAKRLIAEKPAEPVRYNLAALALLDLRQFDAAEAMLGQALRISPGFVAAQLNLAAIALRRGNVDLAYRQYEQIWNKGKRSYPALAALVQIDMRRGRARDAIARLERTCAEQPRALEPRSMLLAYYEQSRSVRKAAEIAKQSYDIQPRNPAVRLDYAKALLADGRSAQAIDVLEALVSDLPDALDARYALASARLAAGYANVARTDAEQALVLSQGKHVPTLALAIQLAADADGIAAAARWVKALRAERGDVPDVQMLEGDIATREKRWPDAIAAYQRALAAAPRQELLTRLVRAQVSAGRSDDARAALGSWLERHPEDRAAQSLLADIHFSAGNLRDAQRLYEAVLKATPEDPALLNNLAWVYLELGNPKANTVAEHALRLMPNSPDIMDTVAWTRFKAGRLSGVQELLRLAAERDPNPEIRFHLASVLVSIGDRINARDELDRILAPGTPAFPSREKAEALRRSLQGSA